MSCPRYEVLVNEGRPLADGDGGGGGAAAAAAAMGAAGGGAAAAASRAASSTRRPRSPCRACCRPICARCWGLGRCSRRRTCTRCRRWGTRPATLGRRSPPPTRARRSPSWTRRRRRRQGNGGGGAHGAADVLQADFPVNVPPPPGADLRPVELARADHARRDASGESVSLFTRANRAPEANEPERDPGMHAESASENALKLNSRGSSVSRRNLLPGVMPAPLQLPRVCGARARPGTTFIIRHPALGQPPAASQRSATCRIRRRPEGASC